MLSFPHPYRTRAHDAALDDGLPISRSTGSHKVRVRPRAVSSGDRGDICSRSLRRLLTDKCLGGPFRRRRSRGNHGPWLRALAGGPSGLGRAAGGSVAGLVVGFDAELGDGFHFGTALAPAAEASSADGRFRVSGDVWTARLGWSAGGAFADAALAWGRSEARSQTLDVLSGGVLDGTSGMAQNHAQATAGHRVSAGPLVAVPSLSLFAGSLEHDARTAHGAVLRTEAPGFTQGYHGWKAGLTLGTEDWLDGAGSLRWRPHLRADYERTTDEGPKTLMVRKADRAGVLSFESEERVAGLPREALCPDLEAELRSGSDAWGVRLGYSGARTDGAPEHGVQARFSLRF